MLNKILFGGFALLFTPILANDFFDNTYWKSATTATVQQSINQGNDVNAHDSDNYPVLLTALNNNADMNIIYMLVESGANINTLVNLSINNIIFLPFERKKDFFKNLETFSEGEDTINVHTQEITILMLSIFQANHLQTPNLIQNLIAIGADVNLATDKGITPLMVSSLYSKSPDYIQILIDEGAVVGAKNYRGRTAFDIIDENINYDAYAPQWQAIKQRLKP